MSVLLKEIRSYDPNAAKVLEKADIRTDSEMQSLTREDLHELFPGPERLKLRRTIFEKINKQKSVEKLLQDLRGFIPEDSIKDALTKNGLLVDYLQLLKNMKVQMDNVQRFLEAHIHLLEEIKANTQQKDDPVKTIAAPTTSTHTPINAPQKSQVAENQSTARTLLQVGLNLWSRSQVTQAPPSVTVKYHMVVTGKTFDAHQQILNKVKSSWEPLNLVETQSSEDCQIVFVFCPIVSRTGTDVEAAMKTVPGDKPVILVVMHHAHEAKHVATTGTWEDNFRIVKHFNVFYHERANGLIRCRENDAAILGIQNELKNMKNS